MTATQSGASALDGLPKSFVSAMRTLFDIMDDQRSGFVKFSEIERRWQDDGRQGLPRGVLSSLRKVTPPDGYLSFERFCAGLQISLLRNKMDDQPGEERIGNMAATKPQPPSHISAPGPPPQPPPPPPLHNRPPSAPLLDQEGPVQHMRLASVPAPPVAPHHPRTERALSLPQLAPQESHPPLHRLGKPDIKMGVGGLGRPGGAPPGPPKPPRVLDRDGAGTHSLDRNLDGRIHQDPRATHSLERDRSRDHCPLRDRERGEAEVRRERGWSLERYLDPPEPSNGTGPGGVGVPLRRAGIRSALQTWHKERTRPESTRPDSTRLDPNSHSDGNGNYSSQRDYRESRPVVAAGGREEARERRRESEAVSAMMRGVGDGAGAAAAAAGLLAVQQDPTASNPTPAVTQAPTTSTTTAATHKKSSRKREPRRHTLQNGIDANMLRRLKQLEAERDMLIQGYEVVERARGWYRQQLHAISERIHYLPHSSSHSQEPSMEAQQEKLHFQLARIHEVNGHLQALMDASERGLPSHINLAIHSASALPHPPGSSSSGGGEAGEERERVVVRLKDQNHLLTEEVSTKSERITVLEREKAALLRELFQARTTSSSSSSTHLHHHHHQALHPTSAVQDSTFM